MEELVFTENTMTERKKKSIILLTLSAIALLALIIWTAWGNTALELNTYTVSSNELPSAFDGYRIAHISDLHNSEMGEGNEKLLAMLREAEPDIIAMTGDLIDSRRTNIDIALAFAEQAMEIAPCYYVPGNHEARISGYVELRTGLENLGVVVLENGREILTASGETIAIYGMKDPSFPMELLDDSMATNVGNLLNSFWMEGDGFTILLSHRPELFETYVKRDADLVLTGHAHGGQFRLPFVGGLVAPNQGFFPRYDSGLYADGNTNMVVSRGIGNSLFPFRFNNRPEVILIELESSNE